MFYQLPEALKSKFNGLICAPNNKNKERGHCSYSQNNKNCKCVFFRRFLIWNRDVHMNKYLLVNMHQIY